MGCESAVCAAKQPRRRHFSGGLESLTVPSEWTQHFNAPRGGQGAVPKRCRCPTNCKVERQRTAVLGLFGEAGESLELLSFNMEHEPGMAAVGEVGLNERGD
jgi:hypothetical protein